MALTYDVEGTWVNQSAELDAGELRRADAAMFAGNGSAIGVHGGIVRHGTDSLLVSVDGADVVTIQPGSVVVPGNAVAGTGPYRFGIASAITLTPAARHSTNSRIDLIVAKQLDHDVVANGSLYKGQIAIVTGTAASVPSAPALPSMAVELGRITVPATGGGTASVVLTNRTFAAAIGGEMVVASSAVLPSSAAKWQRARALDTGTEYMWSGSAWIQSGAYAEAAGSNTITVTSASSGFVDITFPANRFTVAPIVQVSNNSGTGATSFYVMHSTVTASGCRLSAIHRDGTSVTASISVHWSAKQMTSTTAAG